MDFASVLPSRGRYTLDSVISDWVLIPRFIGEELFLREGESLPGFAAINGFHDYDVYRTIFRYRLTYAGKLESRSACAMDFTEQPNRYQMQTSYKCSTKPTTSHCVFISKGHISIDAAACLGTARAEPSENDWSIDNSMTSRRNLKYM